MMIRFPRRKGAAGCVAALLLLALGATARAHEGHDHAEAPPPPPVASGPRFSASSAEVELVGSLEGSTLVLFVDRFASNEPVIGARVELESEDWQAVAAPRPDGAYGVAAGPLLRPGTHPLVLTVEGDGVADLLQATLTVAPPTSEEGGGADDSLRHLLHYATGALIGLALAAGGVWLTRRRRTT